MTGKETVESIGQWGNATFPAKDGSSGALGQALKLIGEANELAQSLGCTPAERHAAAFVKSTGKLQDWHERRPDPDNVPGEVADVGVVLAVLTSRAGIDLGHEVDEKMKINRARTWNAKADGSAQHTAK